MKNYFLLLFLIPLLFTSCKKLEGEGGRSSITGKVYMTDTKGSNQGEYYVHDYRVYIIYGDENDIYDDDMKTNYDGAFEFKNLRPGNYRIYTYTEDPTEASGVLPLFKSVKLEKEELIDIGTFQVEKQ